MSYSQQFTQDRQAREQQSATDLERNRIENEEARKKRLAAEDAQRQAKQAERATEEAARIAEEDAKLKLQLRGTFPGTDAEFEKAWPEMLQKHKVDTALEADRKARETMRRSYASKF